MGVDDGGVDHSLLKAWHWWRWDRDREKSLFFGIWHSWPAGLQLINSKTRKLRHFDWFWLSIFTCESCEHHIVWKKFWDVSGAEELSSLGWLVFSRRGWARAGTRRVAFPRETWSFPHFKERLFEAVQALAPLITTRMLRICGEGIGF